MSYHRSRSIPPSGNGTTIAADPSRGRSKSIRHNGIPTGSASSRGDRTQSRSRSLRRRSTSFMGIDDRQGRSTSISARRGRRSSMGVRSISPSRRGSMGTRPCRSAHSRTTNFDIDDRATGPPLKRSLSSDLALTTSAAPVPALRRSATAPRSALKKTTEDIANEKQSKASLGISAIASIVTRDEKGSPSIIKAVRKNNLTLKRIPKRQVSFSMDIECSQHSGSSAGSAKSSVDEAVRRMKNLQNKYRRSSQEGISISEAEQSRLNKEIPLLDLGAAAAAQAAAMPKQQEKQKKTTPTPGKGKSAAAMSA